mgnify:CR=1 FL=1
MKTLVLFSVCLMLFTGPVVPVEPATEPDQPLVCIAERVYQDGARESVPCPVTAIQAESSSPVGPDQCDWFGCRMADPGDRFYRPPVRR